MIKKMLDELVTELVLSVETFEQQLQDGSEQHRSWLKLSDEIVDKFKCVNEQSSPGRDGN